eukprot:2409817-Amphidinium_carterae.1
MQTVVRNHGSVSTVSAVSATHLGVIPLLSALSVAVSQKVMSEISQKIKSVIKYVITISTMKSLMN